MVATALPESDWIILVCVVLPDHITLLALCGVSCCSRKGGGSIVIDSESFSVTPIVCGDLCLVIVLYAVLSAISSFAITLVRKRALL